MVTRDTAGRASSDTEAGMERVPRMAIIFHFAPDSHAAAAAFLADACIAGCLGKVGAMSYSLG